MGLWARLRRRRPGTVRKADRGDEAHLREWAAAREGVEAFVEPRTTVTDTTVVLVAKDGEWTRRRVARPDGARKLAPPPKIPGYEGQLGGDPPRERDHGAPEKALGERGIGRTWWEERGENSEV